ncbi:QRFP-like peptide receptor [Babylonia areolata]|uniref:QRFP-like peptide receptor n=1 Tax=Babylonia areolata TaxID=304850 RepID=UPI003FD5C427
MCDDRQHGGVTSSGHTCEVGAEVPPPDLTLFRHFPAPSQPPGVPGWEAGVKVVLYAAAVVVAVAVADLLVSAVCMWVHLGNGLTPTWPFGPFVCKVNTFCQVTALTASVLTLTVISVERFTAIVFPLRARWSPTTTALAISLTWLTAVGVACPHLILRRQVRVRWRDREEVWCGEHWPLLYRDRRCRTWQPGKVAYYSVCAVVMYLVPVVIMGCVYSVVTFTLVTRKMPGAVITSTRCLGT